MEDLYGSLASFLEAGETVAVATVISVRGSVPREVGAKMIIHPFGRHVGTVGGGCGEAEVMRVALDVIQTGQPAIVRVDLTEEISLQTSGVCGGIMEVFVEQVAPHPAPGGASAAERIAAVRQSLLAREPVALVTVVSGPQQGNQAVIWLERPTLGSLNLSELEPRVIADARGALQQRQHRLLEYLAEGSRVFVEVQRRSPEMVIVGAGHIAVPLAQIATLCGFSVTVLDDRASFANRERFPTAQRVIVGPLRETVRDLAMDHDTYVVLVTRGHTHDVECLLEVLERPVAYIGMIGSQRRVDGVFQLLEEQMGLDPASFNRVYAPIGIAIGAKTPAEIAVCIMAEVINVLRGGPAVSISDRRRPRERQRLARTKGTRNQEASGEISSHNG